MPPVEDAAGELDALAGEILQRIRVGAPRAGRGLAAAGKTHAAEQHVAQLLGRADVEALAGEFIDLHLDSGGGRGEVVRQAAQQFGVDEDAFHLHRGQDLDERAFQRLVDRELAHRGEARLEQQPEAERDVRVLRRIARGIRHRHAVEGDHRLAGARHLLEGDALVVEVAERQLVHAVADIAQLEHVGDQHGVVDGIHRDAMTPQHFDVVFEVLADLEDGGVLEQRLQHGEGLRERHLVRHQLAAEQPATRRLVLQRNVAGPSGAVASDTPTRLARIESSESVSVSSAM